MPPELNAAQIDIARLTGELDALAAFSSEPAPVVTRIVYSEADLQARAYTKHLFAEAGLTIREDAIGNTFARWIGADPSLPPVATGSHIDAIPNAGKYDGTVGVLGALEAMRALQRSGFRPHRSIELILFTAEEPTRFGIGCLGSRLLSGSLTIASAHALQDSEGNSLDALREAAGFNALLGSVLLPPGHYSAFVELHIEQGPILDRESSQHNSTAIGIVTGIAAPASLRIFIEGSGGHAGAVLMSGREDALAAAAEIILAAESLANSSGSIDTVATVGICQVFPGAINSIPSRVTLSVDLRDTDAARRDRVLAGMLSACQSSASARGISITHEMINADEPAQSDPAILEAITQACTGISFKRMVSRAYHDSLFMSRIAPVAMIFIPCRDGISHRPDEYASPEAIATGVLVLARTLAALASPSLSGDA